MSHHLSHHLTLIRVFTVIPVMSAALALLSSHADHHAGPQAVSPRAAEASPGEPRPLALSSRNAFAPGADFFGPLRLTDETGQSRAVFEDLIKDKVVVVNFVFTACEDTCPLETARLKTVYDKLGPRMGRDLFFISLSIDPKTDTPAVLAAYKKRFKIGAGWTFLTGPLEDVLALRKKLGLLSEAEQDDLAGRSGKKGYRRENHGMALVMGNQRTGQWVKRSNLDDPTLMAHMITALHTRQPEPSRLKSYTDAPMSLAADPRAAGERLFQNRCGDCHGPAAGLGPSLDGVTKRRKAAWLRRWIREPDVMTAERDPEAVALVARHGGLVMPNLKLSESEIDLLMDVLTRRDGGAAGTP
jgi:cytochrome oxidase Cu insertion factor (SCO1/SenC/PrrC family)